MNEVSYMANWDGATIHTDTMISPTTCRQLAAIAEQHVGHLHRLGLHEARMRCVSKKEL